jgi:two-component system NarL family sensor kinase
MQESEIIPVIAGGTLLILAMAVFIILFLFLYKRSHFNYEREKKELKQQYEQTLLQSHIEIQEQTLRHISHELHDNLGQVASLVKINLNTINLNNEEKTKEKIECAKTLIRQLIYDLKSLAVSLNSSKLLKMGLINAIETEVERLQKMGVVNISLKLDTDIPHIDEEKAVIVYRIVQEVLNNALKHSQASEILVSLERDKQHIILEIKDNGIGFDPAAVTAEGSGLGLSNIMERAKIINAELFIESIRNEHTTITIKM